MGNNVDTIFETGRFNAYEAHVSEPIFVAPDNYSSYHDADVDRQIEVILPNLD